MAIRDVTRYLNGSFRQGVTPIVGAAAFTSGDVVGDLMEFVYPDTNPEGRGYIVSAIVSDAAAQDIALELHLFKANPSNSTFTDNSPLNVVAADLDKYITVIPINSFFDSSATSVGKYTGTINGFQIESGDASGNFTTIYGVLVTRGAPTYTANSLHVQLDIEVYG